MTVFVSYIPVVGCFNFNVGIYICGLREITYILFRITSPSVGNKYVGLFNVGVPYMCCHQILINGLPGTLSGSAQNKI